MAIAFRAAGAVKKNAGSGNMAATALPAGHVANDILLLFVHAADNVSCSVSGWTQKLATNNGTGLRQEVWWLRDNGSVSAPTVTHAAGDDAIAVILAYSGVDSGLADPFRDIQAGTGSVAATTATITTGSLTGVVTGDQVIACLSASVVGATDASFSFSTVTGFTERSDSDGPGLGANGNGGAADDLAPASASGSAVTSVATWGVSHTIGWVGTLMALSSAASGSTVLPPLPMVVDTAVARASSW